MLKNFALSMYSVFLFLAGCNGNTDGTPPLQQQQADVQTVNGLLIRGPLQAKTGNRLTVMGQTVEISGDTRIVGTSIENLLIGDVISISGVRDGSVIISAEIRVALNQLSHLVVGSPVVNELGHYSIGSLRLNFSSDFDISIDDSHDYIFEGLFNDELVSLNITQAIDSAHTGIGIEDFLSDSSDSTYTGETGDRLTLDLIGDSMCASNGDVKTYRLISVELTADFRNVTRDVSTEASVNPINGVIMADSISSDGIGLRFADQGITGVDFRIGDDHITRYFATLNTNVTRPVLLKSVDAIHCAFAYFPANNSGCAIAISSNGSTGNTVVSAASSGDANSNGQAGSPGQNGISVVNDNGTIRFGDDIQISDCSVESTNGVPVVTINH